MEPSRGEKKKVAYRMVCGRRRRDVMTEELSVQLPREMFSALNALPIEPLCHLPPLTVAQYLCGR